MSDISTHSVHKVASSPNEGFMTSIQFSNLQYYEDELENGENVALYTENAINSDNSENRLVDFVPEHSSITSNENISDQTLYTRDD